MTNLILFSCVCLGQGPLDWFIGEGGRIRVLVRVKGGIRFMVVVVEIVDQAYKLSRSTVSRIVSIRHPTEGSGIFQKVVDRPVKIGYLDRAFWISLADSDPRLQLLVAAVRDVSYFSWKEPQETAFIVRSTTA